MLYSDVGDIEMPANTSNELLNILIRRATISMLAERAEKWPECTFGPR